MITEQFIEKAQSTGYRFNGLYHAVLSPLAWQTVGEVEKWSPNWYALEMHKMTQALIDGESIDQYLETL